MSEPKTYELRTVADFVALPHDKIVACMTDFQAWLLMVKTAQAFEDESGIEVSTATDVFGWIDDGLHIATITLNHEGKEIAASAHEFAPPERV